MSSVGARRRSAFFWQGLLVLLPVIVLTVVGLVSLRRDERAAEQEARQRAAESLRSLARAMASVVEGDLRQFLALAAALEPQTRSHGEPRATEPESFGAPQAAKWEQLHPGIRLIEVIAAKGLISDQGQQLLPPEIGVTPEPPSWYCELSPLQRDLWQKLRKAEAERGAAGSVEAAYQAFLKSNPGADARQAALYVQQGPEQALARDARDVPTEAGVSFRDIACYRLLRGSQPPLARSLLEVVERQVAEGGSFLTPGLLDLAEELASRSGPAAREKLRQTRQFWESQSRTRAWMAGLRAWPNSNQERLHRPRARWVEAEAGEALALLDPVKSESAGNDTKSDLAPKPGWTAWFVARPVVEAVFARALGETKFLVPEYAQVWLSVESTPLPIGTLVSAEGRSLLGSESQEFGGPAGGGAGRFELRFYLTSRERLVAAAQRRSRLFVGLVGASSLAALFGLGAAYRALRRQVQLNEMKSNFVSSVSHELRAPIASVRLMAESLERGKISGVPRQQEYFRFIGQECRRLSALIENVLDFSRIEQQRKQYEFEPTDLLALTQQTVKLMETYAAERGVRLQLDVNDPPPAALPYPFCADGKALQQALVNLMDNAIKHSPKGGVVKVGLEVQSPKSKLQGRADGEGRGRETEQAAGNTQHPSSVAALRRLDALRMVLWVEDHGEGIPPEEHEKIFDRFYRLGSELRRETQGVGIGLSIVKHVVEAHGGRVLVRSAPGQGSRFTIELPFEPAQEKSGVRIPRSE